MSDSQPASASRAVFLSYASQDAEAAKKICDALRAVVEPLLKGRAPSIYWGAEVISVAQAYGVIGDFGNMALWLRKLFVEHSRFPFTPASVRIDPRFAGTLDAPEIHALLNEFASLDQPK